MGGKEKKAKKREEVQLIEPGGWCVVTRYSNVYVHQCVCVEDSLRWVGG